MINITLKRKKSGELYSCRVEGHAGYASKGEDIVCAAVSILVRVAVLQLQEWKLSGENLEVSLDSQRTGVVDFCVGKHGERLHEALVHLFSFLKLGFESISCEYQDCIRLEIGLKI